jgi:ribosomal protein S27AE
MASARMAVLVLNDDGTEVELAAVDLPITDSVVCPECGEAVDRADAVKLYECGECGSVSTERRCDECNKFMAKKTDVGCPECEEGDLDESEAADVTVVCPTCDKPVDAASILEHIGSADCG